jgi:hypothetical protein
MSCRTGFSLPYEPTTKTGERSMSTGEPRNITLADLMALVAGFALAASFLRDEAAMQGRVIGWTAPLWITGAVSAVSWLRSTCLALTAVAVVRRWRYGGMYSPGEFLALVTGTGMFFYVIRAVIQLLTLGPVGSNIVWNLSGLVTAIVVVSAGWAALAGRGRWPAWLTGLSLALALSGMSLLSVILIFGLAISSLLPVSALIGWWWFVSGIPARLGYCIPLVVALGAELRRGVRLHPWTDAAGLGVGMLLWAASFVQTLGYFYLYRRGILLVEIVSQLVTEAIVWSISYALVVRFGPAVARWLIPDTATAAELPPGPDPYAPPAS